MTHIDKAMIALNELSEEIQKLKRTINDDLNQQAIINKYKNH
tara:strand:- start:75 stop:200 length:126 start_codon:yes stop_codon:yes gene_type:complete